MPVSSRNSCRGSRAQFAIVSILLAALTAVSIIYAVSDYTNCSSEMSVTTETAVSSPRSYACRNNSIVPRALPPPVIHVNETCNCRVTPFDVQNECCSRGLWMPHKMGTTITVKLLCATRISPEALPRYFYSSRRKVKPNNDFRYVIPVRNFYDAVVSGYLYHRRGMECWLDGNTGEPLPGEIPKGYWQGPSNDSIVTDALGLPPRDGRNLCRYFADESVLHGLLLYTDISYRRWFSHLFEEYKGSLSDKRTLIACFDDLTGNPEATWMRMLDHLFPVGHSYKMEEGVTEAGEHSSTSDSQLKEILRKEVEFLDKKWFCGEIGRMANEIGCGGS